MRILFVEPPKDIWFVMGEYLPPPFGILQLAAYVEREVKDVEIRVLDCNAQQIDWKEMESEMIAYQPDIVASSGLATCNTYLAARTLETAKRLDPKVLTVAGGQHFTGTAQESLQAFSEIDVIVRGEGEQTLTELVKKVKTKSSYQKIKGISFQHKGNIAHNPPRPFIENLDDLPFPGYHFVKDLMHKYHFSAMTGLKTPYALVEGSRGCPHRCTYCSQWSHWQGTWRKKTSKRIADEMEFCYNNYGSRFIWLTDDNFGLGNRAHELAGEINQKRLSEDLMWFTQARCDDVVKHKDVLPELRKAGLKWVLLGVESSNPSTLETFKKNVTPEQAKKAVKLLQENDIFTQAMFIIGERKDSAESLKDLRHFANELDPDFSIFAILTPFPGTDLFENARQNGWIEDHNWSNYDMIHAVMPTETLTRKELQEELFKCYRSFYGSWKRRLEGVFSRNRLKRRVYWYMLQRGIVNQLRNLFQSM
ncbi:MAG: B12-binding domain-containing radical SAM protein [Candidatus Bathyarchaeota archaeon]|nr:B12-binding domain-containing radical SAM protein [Candidatus Bathyarchaeota archaeon]